MNCSWSYVILVIDPKDGKLKLFGLKKKLFELQSWFMLNGSIPKDANMMNVTFSKKPLNSVPYADKLHIVLARICRIYYPSDMVKRRAVYKKLGASEGFDTVVPPSPSAVT